MSFDGKTFDPKYDEDRLNRQLGRVFEAMQYGDWLTLPEIARLCSDPPASISARLRDFRKTKFGGYVVERRPRGERKRGLFEYRLLSPEGKRIAEPLPDPVYLA